MTTSRQFDPPSDSLATFLDGRMRGPCGLYQHAAATPDEAQEAMFHFIAGFLRIEGGESVLDIGEGRGSLALFLAERFACRVMVVTPSLAQARYVSGRVAAAGLGQRIRVTERSVCDLGLPPESFGAVVLAGAIEHTPDHRRMLGVAATLLRRHGRLYLAADCSRNWAAFDEYTARHGSRHVAGNSLGHAIPRPLSALVAAAVDAGLSLRQLTDLTRHYQRTTQDWLAGVHAYQASIDSVAPGYCDELIRYLETTKADWGHLINHYAFAAVRCDRERLAAA